MLPFHYLLITVEKRVLTFAKKKGTFASLNQEVNTLQEFFSRRLFRNRLRSVFKP